ncbi:hypothetical protein DICPUDRAFT_147735 [Dictyostelium purpureum]|uniref:CAAX prenyl protease 2/Lysostaphin resistance protein A-like domain-containing protein n=1 Tax=Dictyostelium purpureum TaxID=5786 RepID=F0Z994_DICPU|nr:uncharacterized protein DICPUDRAFT_147735 [Dictyostelium purpureum]EGC39541.1 hypothetical protein DICPUDRAFT_147735 [Dictyostelium purpureum]|eukprot:XP_003283988.1 hypothetical protein DICPUDRAFT_147735 [Dictyostelium purpureum]
MKKHHIIKNRSSGGGGGGSDIDLDDNPLKTTTIKNKNKNNKNNNNPPKNNNKKNAKHIDNIKNSDDQQNNNEHILLNDNNIYDNNHTNNSIDNSGFDSDTTDTDENYSENESNSIDNDNYNNNNDNDNDNNSKFGSKFLNLIAIIEGVCRVLELVFVSNIINYIIIFIIEPIIIFFSPEKSIVQQKESSPQDLTNTTTTAPINTSSSSLPTITNNQILFISLVLNIFYILIRFNSLLSLKSIKNSINYNKRIKQSLTNNNKNKQQQLHQNVYTLKTPKCQASPKEFLTFSELKSQFYNNVSNIDFYKIIVFVLVGPIYEELLFRGVVFYSMVKRCKNLFICILVPSVLFGVFHLLNLIHGYFSIYYVFAQTVVGIGFGMNSSLFFYRDQTIYTPIIIHIFNNMLSILMPTHITLDIYLILFLILIYQILFLYTQFINNFKKVEY